MATGGGNATSVEVLGLALSAASGSGDQPRAEKLAQRLLAADNVPLGGTAEAFARRIASESQANEKIFRAAGIKPD